VDVNRQVLPASAGQNGGHQPQGGNDGVPHSERNEERPVSEPVDGPSVERDGGYDPTVMG
jgi:hypothetical protein